MFHMMQSAGMQPNLATWCQVISALAGSRRRGQVLAQEAYSLWAELQDSGLVLDSQSFVVGEPQPSIQDRVLVSCHSCKQAEGQVLAVLRCLVGCIKQLGKKVQTAGRRPSAGHCVGILQKPALQRPSMLVHSATGIAVPASAAGRVRRGRSAGPGQGSCSLCSRRSKAGRMVDAQPAKPAGTHPSVSC